jgi:type I restriction enzyme M protein
VTPIGHFIFRQALSLPQEAFQHSGAGVKASVVFLRKRAADERPDDDEAIFMAAPANIGYNATGRKTARVTVKTQNGEKKTEIHATDLFETEIVFEKAPTEGAGAEDWQERSRKVLGNTGVLGQFRSFEKRPGPFFV